MCGIIGAVTESAIEPVLEGLGRLEYRGDDSSGISILSNNKIQTAPFCARGGGTSKSYQIN